MNKHLSAIRKAGFGSLFTPTKAIRRVRAIAAYRTQASLTGGCFGTGIFRIYTEFCSAEGEPGRLGQPGRAPRFRRPEGSQGSGKPRHERGVACRTGRYRAGSRPYSPRRNRAIELALAARAIRSRSRTETQRPASVPSSKPVDLAKQHQNRVVRATALRSTLRARNSPGSVGASHCSFETLAHNSRRAAQHL
jgi:hypothetical protein